MGIAPESLTLGKVKVTVQLQFFFHLPEYKLLSPIHLYFSSGTGLELVIQYVSSSDITLQHL